MSRFKGFVALSAAIAATSLIASAANAQVTTVVYDSYTDTGSDILFTGPVGSLATPDILFATNTGYDWHPFGLFSFGSESVSCINVVADGDYFFALDSDDGSYLFIDGNLVINNGGGHAPQTAFGSAFLTAGIHDLRVPFFEDFGGASGVDLYLPSGVSYVACDIPEPGAVAFGVIAAGSVLGLITRRRRKA